VPTCYRHPDRETGLACSECDRPICTDCAYHAPVGLRCPEHATASGRPPRTGTPKAVRTVQRPLARRGIVITTDAIVTKILVVANVAIYLITVAQGTGLSSPGGSLFNNWLLYGPYVANGDWWRLVTSTFLHLNLFHIALNMYALWWLGAAVEGAIGRWRFILLYVVAGLGGSAGALVWTPLNPTVGASGAIFGILGAGLILEWRASGRLIGGFAIMIFANLAFSFGYSSNISVGGHVGGLIAGLLCIVVIVLRGRYRLGLDIPTVVGMVAIGAAAVAISYFKVRGLA
jgi:membrane associated rhomboid family serine protease